LKRGDVVAIIGEKSPEWYWSELGIQAAGGIAAAIPVNATPADIKYILDQCGAKFAIVSSAEQMAKFSGIRSELPALKKIVCWDPKDLKNTNDPLLISFNDMLALGTEHEKTNLNLFKQNIYNGAGGDTAVIYYSTSGPDGLPKGISLTHEALLNAARGFLARFPVQGEDNLISNYPVDSVEDRCFLSIPNLVTGANLNLPATAETLVRDMRQSNPNFVVYAPEQWEKAAAGIQAAIKTANPFSRFFYNLLLPVGYKLADAKIKNKKSDIFSRMLKDLASMLVFRPLRNKLGLVKVRFAASNGPLKSPDAFRLIHAVGIDLRHVYAIPEVGLIACQRLDEIDFTTVGPPALNTEIKINDRGEMLVRGKSMFDGYYNNPEKTAAVLIDGWYHTGISASLNEKGHLVIMDRKKT
jgi:long-chain acyl-CoA synthetase